MMIDSEKLTLITVLIAMVFVPCSFAAVTDPAVVKALEKMPAGSAKLEQELNAELIKAGPDAIKEICDLIVPPGTGDDTKARFTLGSLGFYTSRPGGDAERKMYSGILVDALMKAADKEVKSFFITQLQLVVREEKLQLVVREETVPVYILSAYLNDERLCEPVAMVLLAIGTDAAEKAFLKALPSVDQKNLPTIIQALGKMQIKSATRTIAKHASSKDVTIRRVSQKALANIGDKSSKKILAKALNTNDAYEKSLAVSNYLLLAERLSETGDTRKCAKMCRKIIKGKYSAGNVSSAALSLLTDALGDKAIDDLIDAVDSDNQQLQSAALALADKIPGTKATAEWTKKLKKVSPDRQVKIMGMLGSRKDKTALPALRDVLAAGDKQVTIAALEAIVKLDGTAALSDLMNTSKTASDNQIAAVKSLLMQLPAEAVAAAISEALPQIPANGQVAMIEVLARRRGKQLTDMVNNATAEQKVAVIKLLPAIGGTDALKIVLASTKSADQKLQNAAIRSLARWKDAVAMDALFEIATATKETGYHVMTLKGYLGLVTKSKDTSEVMVANFKKAMSIARRLEEKKLMLLYLGQVRSVGALEYAAGLLGDNDLGPEAALAITKIVLSAKDGYEGLNSDGVGEVLLKARPMIKDAEILKKIDLYINN